MSECERKGKFFGGCRFVPVYNEKPHPKPIGRTDYYCTPRETREAGILREYAGAFCERCGKEVQP